MTSESPTSTLPDLPSRYTNLTPLAEGGMARIYRAWDQLRDADVALKLMVTPDWLDPEEAAFAFRQEFWTLSSLKHPGLVDAYDFGYSADGTPFFTMELVEGYDVNDWLPQDEDAVLNWLPDVVGALGYLHARGFVHGDVSLRNVRCMHAGGSKLMDLGLLAPNGRTGGIFAATMDYIAPEAILQGVVDGRADLYGLGCVMFHALAGRAPYFGDTPQDLLAAHLSTDTPSLLEYAPHVSEALADVVYGLMAKSPDDRPVDAATLARWLGIDDGGLTGRSLLAPPVIGRDDVRSELAQATDAPGAITWLAGPAGLGKTRLLDDARAAAQLQGRSTVLLRGADAGAAPYEAVRPWLLGLAGLRARGAMSLPVDPVRDRLAPYLAAVLPELGVTPAPPLEGQQERLRLHDAIATWVETALPEALWLVDDADRLDAGSQALLTFLRNRDTGCGWSWLLAARTPPESASAETVWLEPLPPEAIAILAGALLGQMDLPPAVAERLPEATAGLPAATEAALSHWIETGALHAHDGRWEVTPGATLEPPEEPSLVYAGGFRALDPLARRLGAIATILGEGTPIRCLSAVAGLDDAAFFAALAHLERLDVLATEGRSIALRRTRPAETEAAGWAPADQARAHGDAARWLAGEAGSPSGGPRTGTGMLGGAARPGTGNLGGNLGGSGPLGTSALPVNPFPGPRSGPLDSQRGEAPPALGRALKIVRHHLLGDDPVAAVPWLFMGARLAIRLFAPEPAEELLRLAIALPDISPRDRRGLQALLGELLRLRGLTDEALALLEGEVVPAMREARDTRVASTLATIGVLHQIACRYDAARSYLGEALTEADNLGDLSTRVRALMATARVAFFSGDARTADEVITQAEEAARVASAANAKATGTAPRPVPELGTILSFHGYLVGASDPSRLAEGLRLIDAGTEADRAIDNSYGLFEAATNRGNLCLAGGRVAEAVQAFGACLDMARRLGFTLERCFAHLNVGAARLESGDVPGALEQAEEAIDWSRRQNRRFPEGFALGLEGVARIYLGELPEGLAVVVEGLAVARAIENRYLSLHALAFKAEAHLLMGQLADAQATVDEAQAIAKAIGVAEVDDKLARWGLAASVSAGEPGVLARLDERLATVEARGASAEIAHTRRWRAEARLAAGDAAGASEDVQESIRLATELGLGLLRVELAWLGASAADDTAGLADARDLAAGAGHRLMELACDAALVARGAAHVDLVRDELERLMATWEPADREAFLAPTGRAGIAALLV